MDEFSSSLRYVTRRRLAATPTYPAHWRGAVGVCPGGHDGWPCLGVIVSERDRVTTEWHHSSEPDTTGWWRRVGELLLRIIADGRRRSAESERDPP